MTRLAAAAEEETDRQTDRQTGEDGLALCRYSNSTIMVRRLRYFAKFEISLFCIFAANIVSVMPTNDTTPPLKTTTKMPTTPVPLTTTSVAKSCKFFGESKQNGQYWTHRGQFNVTCLRGKIKVLNCVTERGVRLALGTKEFLEDGVRYSCQLNVAMDRARQRETLLRQNTSIAAEHPVHDCDQQRQQNGAAGAGANARGGEFVRDGFVVDCASGGILGCLDISGDLVKSDHFYVLSAWRLRRCEVYARGRYD
ncbi:hypothetical protein niasHT_006496 [Heterodera trifolii]|uniref:Ig-like domain-containing protein n=1 Tax=Heterodera trifolii TaxID=157864 RepID=A0ABD2LTU5_9BILA